MIGYAYKNTPIQPGSDYTIETDIRFPREGSYGGGVVGRLNPITGQRYAVRVDPGTSSLHLIRFDDGFHGDGQVMGPGARIPATGSGWHHLKVAFNGTRIQVFYDNAAVPNINIHDASFKSGYAGLDFWSDTDPLGPIYNNFTISEIHGAELFGDDFGEGSSQS